jgi:hypothetical protein
MKEALYQNIVYHLSEVFSIDINEIYKKIPNIHSQTRKRLKVEEIRVRDQIFYYSNGYIYTPIFNIDSKEAVAKKAGYLKDNTIYLTE